MTVGAPLPQRGSGLPSGEVTFLVADIENSTRRLIELGPGYDDAQDAAFRPLREAVAARGGVVFKTTGDGLLAAFADTPSAVAAAATAQRAMRSHSGAGTLAARLGLHVGPARPTADGTDYVSLTVHQATRVCDAGHGGQIVLSDTAAAAVLSDLPPGATLRDRGPHLLKGLPEPIHLYELRGDDLGDEDRPLRAARLGATMGGDRSSFVGREQELRQLAALTQDNSLVSVIGPGGVGKTRLLRETLATIQHGFAEGAWFVPLADIVDPALVPNAVASALGIGETAGSDATTALVTRLRTAHLLVALDNCEQVVEPTAELVATLLAECPSVQFVLTSREPLNLPTEVLLPLAPLDVPADTVASAEDIESTSAVRLLADRARQVDPTFTLTPDTAVQVARICQLMDGLPLAIELVAPLVRQHTLSDLVEEVESRAITIEGRGRPHRHLTLRDSIGWGYRLLGEVEQRVFRRAGVFAGGFTLAAARAVLADEMVPPASISPALGRLLDMSLVSRARLDRTRYRLLQTIRMFALTELASSGELAEANAAHARWYLELAESSPADKRHEVLAPERDNLRAALTWAAATDDELLCRLVLALVPFWRVRGEFAEGRRWLQATHGRAAAERMDMLNLAEGTFAFLLGDYPVARDLLHLAIDGFDAVGDEVGCARATDVLARLSVNRGEGETAQALFEKALVKYRDAGEDASVASVLRALGRLARFQGLYDTAAKYVDEAFAASKRSDSPQEIAETLHDRGRLAVRQGDFGRAADLLQRALKAYQDLGDEQGAANGLYGLSRAFIGTGDLVTGTNLLRASTDRHRALGDLHGIGLGARTMGRLLLDSGDVDGATESFNEALRVGDRLDSDPIRMMALVGLADVALLRHDDPAARQHLTRARQLATAIRYQSDLVGIEARLAALGNADD